ncbi:hypothetical protein GN244_ATG03081 [Phytophthora infestans]|uniref:N-acetyltransferase domain-containing protein n=1 Tax=Phytophthora infestans TaxID=4787 RepID=A0A833SQV9_PHYIN|nr:hypothetical protein GN244_ATG03081 [Phytophthora infestans]KAF4148252.1 hypothetical protein GN958_ATG02576 [Phytophthora infestans]
MAPTVAATMAIPPAPVPANDATKIVIRPFRQDDLPQVIQLFKEGMLCYPAQQENPRLLQFIDDSLKTDLSDIEGTYIAPMAITGLPRHTTSRPWWWAW